MKVHNVFSTVRTTIGAALVVAFAATVLYWAPPAAPAHAITRDKIIERANSWVKKKVRYSQRSYYKGYRRDCSGFVSMAWKLNRSYTTRTISSRAKRIPVKALKPGDAVLTRGHVTIFGGWKSKKKRTYYALEQTTWGSHAKKRVRKIPSNAKALRYKKLSDKKKSVALAPGNGDTAVVAARIAATSDARLAVSPVIRQWTGADTNARIAV